MKLLEELDDRVRLDPGQVVTDREVEDSLEGRGFDHEGGRELVPGDGNEHGGLDVLARRLVEA